LKKGAIFQALLALTPWNVCTYRPGLFFGVSMITKKRLKYLVCSVCLQFQPCEVFDNCAYLRDFVKKAKEMGILEPPKLEERVKSKEEIEKILKEQGYRKDDDGVYRHKYRPLFANFMFEYCGGEPFARVSWDSSWLEVREIDG
jgi:hypothetical protein